MLIFTKKTDLQHYLEFNKTKNSTVGFVPTMGALHAGHLSLLKKSIQNNTYTVISIFVNPTQFNNSEDLKKYPRTLDEDIEKIKSVYENILIYAPDISDVYENETTSTHFDFDGLENQMEGKFRPGHFDGVGTVVKKLFEIVKPANAYFGEKDFQQLQIIKKLVSKNNISVNIVGCEIFREKNGLAMSSRNERLSTSEKEKASLIYKTIIQAKTMFATKTSKQVTEYVINTFNKNPDFELEYFEIADEATLKTCVRKSKYKKYRGFIAVFINKIRLIDTISF